MSRIRVASRIAFAVSVLLVPALASAATLPAARATLERLRLSPFSEGLTVDGLAAETPRLFHLDLLAHYESGPVVGLDSSGDPNHDVIADRLTFDVLANFRVDDWLEAGLRLPVVASQTKGDALGGVKLGASGIADPELSLRARVLRPEDAGVGLALIATGSLPMTGGRSFIGERAGTISPTVALTRPLGDRATLGLDLGATFRWDDPALDPLGGGDELFASLGGVVRVGDRVSLIAEVMGDTGADDPFAEDQVGLEALGAVRAQLGAGFQGLVGGGTSLIDAYGHPDFRVLAGIGWAMAEPAAKQVEPAPLAETEPAPKAVEPEEEPEPATAVVVEPPVQETPKPAPPAPKRVEPEPARAEPPAAPARAYAPRSKEKVHIHFPNGGAELTPEAKAELNSLVDRLGRNTAAVSWRVEGYSDSTGALVPNRRISRAREEAVRDYLRGRGFPEPWREDWYGPAFPVGDNATAAGRAENRRSEITVVIE